MTITAEQVKWNKGIPGDCTPAKLNLSGAYRTIYKNVQVGDVVRVRQADGRLVASATRATKDSFWVQVVKVERGARGWVTIHCAGNRTLPSAAAQTAITRKERRAETESRLARDAAKRAAVVAANAPQAPVERVTWKDDRTGFVWRLLDRNDQPVAAGDYRDPEGDAFRIEANPAVNTWVSSGGYLEPRAVQILWSAQDMPGWTRVEFLGRGWYWHPEFC